ncbi:uncharacterized protein BO87DRAFT_423428 [Aspergillus neoniger CBS 115656]|uniref:Uncharacterized protein n=1 Tax=Aspergillus neoniger (strain CBS 115656) TaxID=1448310 RepID=A0A318YRV9_ASPNB|nr:hypothetical protein BO87DRAFT_423428 [Aspergillus neoniger CBS 115656]PYH37106.1 hypothetical protein BO87DRAFT_423428 [Aspergillus neoniger CBS 115656]
MEEKLYREAYEEITLFLHSSPRVKSIAIDRYVDLHKWYQSKTWETHLYATLDPSSIDVTQGQLDKHQEAAKYALIVYRLSDFSDDITWKITFSTLEEQHLFLRLLHLDDTNEEYKQLASEKDKTKNEGSSSRSGTTPLSEKNTTPAVENKKELDLNAVFWRKFDAAFRRESARIAGHLNLWLAETRVENRNSGS